MAQRHVLASIIVAVWITLMVVLVLRPIEYPPLISPDGLDDLEAISRFCISGNP